MPTKSKRITRGTGGTRRSRAGHAANSQHYGKRYWLTGRRRTVNSKSYVRTSEHGTVPAKFRAGETVYHRGRVLEVVEVRWVIVGEYWEYLVRLPGMNLRKVVGEGELPLIQSESRP